VLAATKRCEAGSIGVFAAVLMLAAPGWAQRGRGGIGMRGPAVARVAPRTAGRLRASYFGPAYNRFGRRYWRRRESIPIWWGGGLYYWDTGCDYSSFYDEPCEYSPFYDEPQPAYSYETQPPPIIIQLPPTTSAEPPASESQPAPQEPDLGPLILILRGGQVVKAVAFTIAGDQLTYITPEGMRRSFAVAELDKGATRETNEANGTTLVLPR
jgi:hypothetical protein